MNEKGTKDIYNNIYNNNIYISLSKASELCDYSQEYLSLRARQGKLKATKIDGRWMTTQDWLNEYTNQTQYLSLQDAAKDSPYSQEYLSLRARQGKLKAIKQGRNWVTTKDWVEKYLQDFSEKEIEERTELKIEEKKVEKKIELAKEEIPIKKDPLPSDGVLRAPVSDLTRPFFSFIGSVLKIVPRVIPALWGAISELVKSVWRGLGLAGSTLPIIWHGLRDSLEKIIDFGHSVTKEVRGFSINLNNLNNIDNPIDQGLALVEKVKVSKLRIPQIKIPNFNIYQPKVVVIGILISSLVLGSFLAFNPGARASFAQWADESFEDIVQVGEGMADFVFGQSRNLVELAQTTVGKTFETSSDFFNQMPQLIEETTQTIEELPVKIASSVQGEFKNITPQFFKAVQGIKNLEVVILNSPKNISEQIIQWAESTTRFVQETNQGINRWSQKNEQLKNNIKSGLAQLPQKIKEFQIKAVEGQNQTAEIIKSLPDAIKILSTTWSQDARAWVEAIPEWTNRKISQTKKFAFETKDKFINLPRTLSQGVKYIFTSSAESIAQGLVRFSGNMTATISGLSNLGDEASQKVEGSVDGAVKEIDKSLLGFVTAKDKVSASIFGTITNLNSELSQSIASFTSKTEEAYEGAVDSLKLTQSKLGDAYLGVIDFLTPDYGVDWGVTQIQKQLVQEPTIQTVTQQVTRQEVTQITQTVDLTEINNQIAQLNSELDDLKSKVASKIDYTVPSYAPVYIPSSGLQVEGHSMLSTLNVTGSGSIGGTLSVRQSMIIGNTTDNIVPTLDVYANSNFYNSATFNAGISASSISIVDSLSVGGDAAFSGIVTISTSTTETILTVQQYGTGNLVDFKDSETTVFSIQDSGNIVINSSSTDSLIALTGTSTSPIVQLIASTTDTHLDFKLAGQGPYLNIKNNGDISKFYIDNNGNVGIGTTSPTALLDISKTSSSTTGLFKISSSTDGDLLIVDSTGNVGIGTTTPAAKLHIVNINPQVRFGYDTANYTNLNIGSDGALTITPTNSATTTIANALTLGQTKAYFLNNGKIGFGTTGPSANLEIATTTGTHLRLAYNADNYSNFVIGSDGALTVTTTNVATTTISNNLRIGTNDSTHGLGQAGDLLVSDNFETDAIAYLDANVYLGDATTTDVTSFNSRIGTHLVPTADNVSDLGDETNWLRWRKGLFGTSVGIAGTATTTGTSLSFNGVGDITTGGASTWQTTVGDLTIQSAANYIFGSGGSEQMRLTTAGNFGIGTSTPDYKFSVVGDMIASTTSNQLTLAYDLANNYYSTLSIGSDGDFTIDLATSNSTTTFNDNVSILGYLNVEGNATSSGTLYVANDLTSGSHYPISNDNYTLGSDVLRWADLYLGPASVHMGASGNEAIFGYDTTNNYLSFDPDGDAGTPEMVFDDNGNLGIGTTTPDQRLTVIGMMHASSTSEQLRLTYDLESSKYASMTMGSDGDFTINLATTNSTTTFSDNVSILGYLNVEGNATTTGNFAANDIFYVQSGNVGIGSANPGMKLDIDAASNTSGLRIRGLSETTEIADMYLGGSGEFILSLTSGNSTGQFFDLRSEDDDYGLVLRESNGVGTATFANFYVVDAITDYMNIVLNTTQSTTGLVLDVDGNVGIGTTTPDYKLSVAGQIYASSTSNQLVLTNDLVNGYYSTFSMDNSGDLTIDLITANATTTFSDNVLVSNNLQVDGALIQSGAPASFATTTVTGDFTVQTSDAVSNFYVQNNTGNVGIADTDPSARLTSSSTVEQLRLIESEDENFYASFTVGSDGDLTVDLATSNSTTTFSDNVSILGYLNVEGNATTTGNFAANDTFYVQTGNVGIGTADPSNLLHVYGSADILGHFQSTDNLASIQLQDDADIGYILMSDDEDAMQMGFSSTIANTNLTINNDGNVGIGTTTPDYKFSVVGNMIASTTSNQLTLAYDLANNAYTTFSIGSDGDLTVDLATTNSTTTFSDNVSILGYLNVEGNATSSGTLYVANDLTSGHHYPISNDNYNLGSDVLRWADLYLGPASVHMGASGNEAIFGYDTTNNYLSFDPDGDAGTPEMVFNDNGNLGIGTTTPDQRLTVIGMMHASSTSEQLRLTYDLESSMYTSFTVDSNGDMTIDLATTNATTTFSDNAVVSGNLTISTDTITVGTSDFQGNIFDSLGDLTIADNLQLNGNGTSTGSFYITGTATTTELFVQGAGHIGGTFSADGNLLVNANATTTGSLYTGGDFLTDGTGSFANTALTIDSSGNLVTTGYASSTTGLFTQGNAHVGGNTTIDGNSTTTGAMYIGGGLGVGVVNTTANSFQVGQCVTGDTRLKRRRRRRKKDGSYEYIYDEVEIKDIKQGDEILTLDDKTGETVWSKVKKLVYMGKKPIIEITTVLGRKIRTTGNHPYFARVNTPKIKKPKLGVFIDDANIFYAQRKAGWRIDLKKLKKSLSREFDVSFANYYTALPSEKDKVYNQTIKFLDKIKKYVTLKIKPLKYIKSEDKIIKKGDVDLEIALDVARNIKDLDVVVIVSGDSDYTELRKFVLENGKKIIFLGFNSTMAWELRLGKYVLLDNARKEIELSNKKTTPKPKLGRLLLSLLYASAPSLSSGGMWRKVSQLKTGQEIAVLDIPLKTSDAEEERSDGSSSDVEGAKVIWDEIKTMRKLKSEDVYDIEVEGTHNFIGNNIVAHNTAFIVDSTGNVGIGTTTPDYKLSVVGGMFASTTSNQLTLAYDLADSDYGTFSIDSTGDLTIDLATTNATTTFSDNVSILGYLNVEGNATTTGSLYTGGDFLTDGTGSFANTALTIDSSGNLVTTGYASSTTGLFTQGNAHVGGNTSLDGTLGVLGAVTFSNTFVVTGTSDFQGDVSDSAGDLTFADNIVVTGTSDFQGAISDSDSDLSINDNVSITGNATTTGNFTAKNLIINPDTTQSITASTTAILSGNSINRISSDADYVMISTPTIATSTDGHILILKNTGSFTIELQDNSVLSGSGVYHEGTNGTLASGQIMTLVYIEAAGGWIIQSHPNSPTNVPSASSLIDVRNTSGSTITAGVPVYITGYNVGQGRVTIGLADADDSTKMPSIGLTTASITNNNNGTVIASGILEGINTSAYSVEDGLYVATTAGTLTNTRPSVDAIQRIGTVSRANANGSILVVGAGRSNDVPQNFTYTNSTSSKMVIGSTNPTNDAQLYMDGDGYLRNATTTGSINVDGDFLTDGTGSFASTALTIDSSGNLVTTGYASSTTGIWGQGDLHIGGNTTLDGTLDILGSVTVPNDSISAAELDESDTFTWTGAHSWNTQGVFTGGLRTNDLMATTTLMDSATTTDSLYVGGILNVTGTGSFASAALTIDSSGNLITTGYASSTTGLFTQANGHIGGTFSVDGASTMLGNLDMSNNLILNIGNAGTDFTSTGGLTMAGNLQVNGSATTTGSIYGPGSFVVQESGNVGIGTTNPSELLHVNGSDNVYARITSTGANSRVGIELQNDFTSGYQIEVDDIDVNSDSFYIRYADEATPRFMINKAGNVGIGTTNPASKLQVAVDKNIAAVGSGISGANLVQFSVGGSTDGTKRLSLGYDTTNNYGIIVASDSSAWRDIYLSPNTSTGIPNVVIQAGGNVGIGTTTPKQLLTVNSGGLCIDDGTGVCGSQVVAAGNLYLKSATTTGSIYGPGSFVVQESGNVGIGTTSPSEILSVGNGGKFQVASAGDDKNIRMFHNDSHGIIDTSSGGLFLDPDSGTVYLYDGSNAFNLYMYNGATVANVLNTNGDSYFNGGNVGIGTTNPTRPLTVNTGAVDTMALFTSTAALPYIIITGLNGSMGVGTDPTGGFLESSTGITRIKQNGGSLGALQAASLTMNGGAFTQSIEWGAVAGGNVLGRFNFIAPDESSGGDANLLAASIVVQAESDFTATNNATSILFQTGASETATTKMVIDSTGNVGIGSTSPSYLLGMEASGGGFYDAATNAFTTGPSFSWLKQDREVLTKADALDILNNTNIEQFKIIEEVDTFGAGADTHIGIMLDEAHTALSTKRGGSITGFDAMRTASVAFRGVQLFNQAIDITSAPTSTPSITIDLIGNIGIGTTTPMGKLAIQTDAIDSSPAVAMYNASSSPLMFLMNNGNFGIATSVPTHILTVGQGMGNAIADGWEVYSSREYKTDITYLEEKDYDDILNEIEGMNVATYRWKKEIACAEPSSTSDVLPSLCSSSASDVFPGSGKKNLGVIAEEAPEQVLAKDGKSVSLYDYASFAIAGVKALKSEVDQLRATLEANGYLSDSSATPQNDSGIADLTIAEDGTVVINKLKAKFIETENLKVRAENSVDSGITIYDSKTGTPYCLYIEYGVPATRSGECSDVLDTVPEVLEVSAASEEPVATTTEPVVIEVEQPIATTTPEVIVEEPIVEETATSTEPVIEEPVVEEPVISTSTPAVIVE